MIEYLLKITVVPFKNNKQQEKVLKRIMMDISEMNYVGSCGQFYFKRSIEHICPKYSVPKKKVVPEVFEEPECEREDCCVCKKSIPKAKAVKE